MRMYLPVDTIHDGATVYTTASSLAKHLSAVVARRKRAVFAYLSDVAQCTPVCEAALSILNVDTFSSYEAQRLLFMATEDAQGKSKLEFRCGVAFWRR